MTIRDVHRANFSAYGDRKLQLALKRAGVEDVGRDRAKRLMRAHGIPGAKRRGKPWRTTIADPTRHGARTSSSATSRRRCPTRSTWRTYTPQALEGVVYLAFVIDVYSRRVVGWQLTSHMRASLVCDALKMAVSTRPRGADVRIVHHSDRGSPVNEIAQPGPRDAAGGRAAGRTRPPGPTGRG